jgi:hypothetical protein
VVPVVLAAISWVYSGKPEILHQLIGRSREADPDGGDMGQGEEIIQYSKKDTWKK